MYCLPLALRFTRTGEVLLGLSSTLITCFPVHSRTGYTRTHICTHCVNLLFGKGFFGGEKEKEEEEEKERRDLDLHDGWSG